MMYDSSRSSDAIKLIDNTQGDATFISSSIVASVFVGELRKADHVQKSVPVYYRSLERGIPWTLSRTVSISKKGISILIKDALPVGSSLEIEIGRKLMDTKEVFWIRAKVSEVTSDRHEQVTCFLQLEEKRVGFHRINNVLWSLADINSWFYDAFTADCKGVDAGDAFPGSRTFALKKAGIFLGTVSLVAEPFQAVSLEAIFPQEIARLRADGKILAEAKDLNLNSELIDTKQYSFTSFKKQAYLFKLFKTLLDHVRRSTQITDIIIGCHLRQEFFYKYLMFETLGLPKDQGPQGPVILMRLDIYRMKRMTELLKEGPGLYFFKPL